MENSTLLSEQLQSSTLSSSTFWDNLTTVPSPESSGTSESSSWSSNETTTLLSTSTVTTSATLLLGAAKNLTNHFKANAFSPTVVHFTYYELNFFDIIFIAFVFFLKFFITSLFLIFALVAINGNSYPQLLARCTESHRLSTSGPNRRRRDLLFTLAVLNIISGNLDALLGYISSVQCFLFITCLSGKWSTLKSALTRWILCFTPKRTVRPQPTLSPPRQTTFLLNGNSVSSDQPFNPKIHDSGRTTPHVVFIDYEPGLQPEEEIELTLTQTPEPVSIPVPPVIDLGPSREYLPVLRLRVKNPADGSSLITRARLDPHSICSYISPIIAANLRMRRHFIWPCFFRSFPGPEVKYVYQASIGVLQSLEDEDIPEVQFSDHVELLLPTQTTFPPSPSPSTGLAFLAKNTCGITLSDDPGTNPDSATEEVGLIIGQDLLYKYFLKSSTTTDRPHKAFILESSLTFIRTAYGWVCQGSTKDLPSVLSPADLRVVQLETQNLGIFETDFQRKHKCTDTIKILCCPLQILVSLLVLIIYILIPYIDALLYLYNILFHLAITFALVQILAFILGPLVTLLQSLIAWRLTITCQLLRSNTIRVYLFLSAPLHLIYRWFLGAVWVSLYWFLSMGKALFNQWNYSQLESSYSIKFSGSFLLKTLGPAGQVIRVKLDPMIEQSSISAFLANSHEFNSLFVKTQPKTFENGINGISLLYASRPITSTPPPNVFTIVLPQNHRMTLRIKELPPENTEPDLEPNWILLGSDLLDATSDPELNTLFRSIFLLDTVKRPARPIEVTQDSPADEEATEQPRSWALEASFYPHGWLHILSCTYWFRLENFIYLLFFLLYSFLLATVYFCLIAPNELTLISLRPTMFRYIGNFLFSSSRWT